MNPLHPNKVTASFLSLQRVDLGAQTNHDNYDLQCFIYYSAQHKDVATGTQLRGVDIVHRCVASFSKVRNHEIGRKR